MELSECAIMQVKVAVLSLNESVVCSNFQYIFRHVAWLISMNGLSSAYVLWHTTTVHMKRYKHKTAKWESFSAYH